jgi:hypothetical protein
MSTLPVYDEKRREFLDTPPARAASDRPSPTRRLPASSQVRRPAAEPAAPPAEAPASRVDFFVQFLGGLRHALGEAGKHGDADIVGEIAEYLLQHKDEDATLDPEASPAYAVAAAYIAALTTITSTDESLVAQLLARKMVSLGYELPKRGGDTRGWKRLLLWRDRLERHQFPAAMTDVYKRALEFARQDLDQLNFNAALQHAMAVRNTNDPPPARG